MRLKHFLAKANSFVKNNVALIAVGISIVGLGIGLFNTYQIKNMVFSAPGAGGVKAEDLKKILKELPKDAPFLGNPEADLVVVEFGDFQCPFCGRFFNEVLPDLKKEYIDTGKIKFVYLDYAFLGQESKDAAEAAKCAAEQGKFWQYHDELYKNQKGENQGAFNATSLKKFAQNIGLEPGAFAACVSDTKYDKLIADERILGEKYGVRGTPNFIIGENFMRGAAGVSNFRQVIDQNLK